MHTHTILKTSSGSPFRADRVIAVNWRGDDGIRIVMDGGEVLVDHFKTEADAARFVSRIEYGMKSIDPDELAASPV
jgi:hypothetical protein